MAFDYFKIFNRLHFPTTLLWGAILCLAWLTGCGNVGRNAPPKPTLAPVEKQGQTVFQTHCAACHAVVPDVVVVGPSLAGIANIAADRQPNQPIEQYLQISILKPDDYLVEGFPDAMTKDFGKKLTGEELDAVVAYMLTLKQE